MSAWQSRMALQLGLALAALAGALAPGAALADDLPANATPMSAAQLLQLYGGKSWDWGAGAGYFALDGRKFLARTGEDTRAVGKWKINDRGRLCFSAVWTSSKGAFPADTCFLHAMAEGAIYQRKLPDGVWYLFRHAKLIPEDAANKLVRADLVSEHLAKRQTKKP
jgi:hypothetical protein